MKLACSFVVLAWAASTNAHTYVWSTWVNGVDQGSGVGIREPAYNGPPLPDDPPFGTGSGYANSPVRDLNSIDMRCNVLGDIPDPHTTQVQPNDTLTLEWHHNDRTADDDIIDTSHKGASNVYLSPNPPTDNSFVKIQEEGQFSDGSWYVAGKLNSRLGKQDVQIPADLAPGYYILRSELLALHEADVSHFDNPNRGVQIYISCIQLEVTGNGQTVLPAGVSFPGAYNYSSPGIVYNLYEQPAGAPPYQIPGPSVWSGAAPSPDPPAYGSTVGYTIAQRWSTWIGDGFSTATLATSLTIDQGTALATQTYVPHWPTVYEAPPSATAASTLTSSVTLTAASTPAPIAVPSTTGPAPTPAPTATAGAVVKYGQCGGIGYIGSTLCEADTSCQAIHSYYSQCL